jgi:hypothetical protein
MKIKDTLKKVGEQVLHFAWSAYALLPIGIWGLDPITGATTGVLLALPREFVDQWPINKWWDTAIDLAFFALGGATIGLLF